MAGLMLQLGAGRRLRRSRRGQAELLGPACRAYSSHVPTAGAGSRTALAGSGGGSPGGGGGGAGVRVRVSPGDGGGASLGAGMVPAAAEAAGAAVGAVLGAGWCLLDTCCGAGDSDLVSCRAQRALPRREPRLRQHMVFVLKAIVNRSIPDVCATCHIHATCQQSGGKSVCICNYGFVGNGRTHCQDKDECQIGASKICGNHTLCHNTHGSFYCVCLDGYRASNNNKTFIPNDGTNCTDIDECEESGLCGQNARCVNTEGSYMCYCNDGYKLETGELSFHQDGKTVSCKEIGCGSPPEMKHGYIVGNYSLLPGSAVHYECQEGFYSNEGKFSYCTANETWEPATLSCKGVDCGVPPPVSHATASVGGTTYRSEVTYKCDHGYLMAGSSHTAVCNAKGQWDGPDLVCKEIDCGKPLLIPHTTMTWDNSTTLRSRVYYHCKEGYYFNGDRNFSECTIDQSWENITYVCKEEELLSNISIFNETCVRWQRKTGRLGVQETYTFHILGQRLDEKMFSEDVIFNISTSEDNPKVCLDLNSGSNYMVNITTISSTNITVSVTVAIQTKVKEAFNNVLIFNDTCLKWRRNVRGTGVEDRYSFHVQGQRWYQKNFHHEMTFELSTHKQAPEVCLDLQPGTNYSINISMVALNFSLLVSMTTQITGGSCHLFYILTKAPSGCKRLN
ncbi:sushi domain-containing protein 1-like [Cyanistes caeruleus]|uniref:sushi domain-containing protein 1-like n=1 Tax=Cyanistes caeruleus TaxID=156563 RepID=UPI000CDA50D6|nr:sushi domain-containing protein 1-like [Cyanistes caeruleus]